MVIHLKRKVIIILYLEIVQNNDTMKLALFSTTVNNILTKKNVTQMAKRIKWNKKLKLSQGLIQQLPLIQMFCTVTKNVLFLKQKAKKIVITLITLKFRLKSFVRMPQKPRVLNMPLVLSMPRFWILNSEFWISRVTQGSEYC